MKYLSYIAICLISLPVAALGAAESTALTHSRVSGNRQIQVTITQSVKNISPLEAQNTKTGFAFRDSINDRNENAPWLRKSIGLNVFDFLPQVTPGLDFQRREFESATINIADSKAFIPNFTLLESGTTQLLGQEALFWDYTTDLNGRKVRTLRIVTTYKGKDVQAMMTVAPEDFENFHATFSQILDTWRVDTTEEETYYGKKEKEQQKSSTSALSSSSSNSLTSSVRMRVRKPIRKASSSQQSLSSRGSRR